MPRRPEDHHVYRQRHNYVGRMAAQNAATGAPRGPPPVPVDFHPLPAASIQKRDLNCTHIDIPDKIYDSTKKVTYTRGRFLGKGGFARCYEAIDPISRQILACKVVNKTLLLKPHQREKMAQEITIHRSLKHEFVVDFHSYFEDDQNVYVMLELCGKKSLMELQKRRRILSEPEARYFLRQIVLAVLYLHDKMHIIHRDLKLGNIFITDSMELKIGDFGLATTIEHDGERKRTLCGTPNYIAPEVLAKRGHSYEVDVWSIGCILYTLLVGKPPFETQTLRDTYTKIKRGDYYIPTAKVGQAARNLLTRMLQVDPKFRPTAKEILESEFLTQGLMPHSLPASCLTMAPRFEKKPMGPPKQPLGEKPQPEASAQRQHQQQQRNLVPQTVMEELTNTDILGFMKSLRSQIQAIVQPATAPDTTNDDETEDPSLCPMLWICKWVDYSDKYGFGYQLSDDSIGVSFNDQTKLILLPNTFHMHYIDKVGVESYHTIERYPPELVKKVKLLNYFQQYMRENLLKASGGKTSTDTGCIARLPNLWTWFRTSRAVVMVLSNGTLQINNFRDHSKMILCPLLGAISILGSDKTLRTYKMASMVEGLTEEMVTRLKYALEKLDVIIGNPKNQIRPKLISSPMKSGSNRSLAIN